MSEDLKHSLSRSNGVNSPSVNIYQQVKDKIRSFYLKIANLPVFKYGIIAFFLFQFITQLIFVITLIFFTSNAGDTQLSFQILKNLSAKVSNLSFLESAELLSVIISGIFIFAGTWRLPKSRLKAYRMYERSILVSIFITQVFIFYKEQFGALVGLAFNLLILAGIKFLIRREADLLRKSQP